MQIIDDILFIFDVEAMKLLDKKAKARLILKTTIKAWIAFAITIGFVMFIFEETMQTEMFAGFGFVKNEDCYGMKENVKQLEATTKFNKLVVYGAGWLNPILFPAYKEYIKANEQYIKSEKSSIKKFCK